MSELRQVTVTVDSSGDTELDIPIASSTARGALKKAIKFLDSLEANSKKKCVCCDDNRLSSSLRCQTHTDMFGEDL